ncbi:unnamed protein product [Thelazia callipaeda]|uniref:UDP-glucuronosyltransferase n=1 Tax=Thelazia callipaeda TaxID=103827 RepID=A0A0N5CNN2_THECL|nr:unnamed protein product [Thelazia callipaeda]
MKTEYAKIYLFIFVLLQTQSECYKILVYNPKLSYSHVKFFGQIADLLVEAGHDVVTYMPDAATGLTFNGTKLARIIPGPPLIDNSTLLLEDIIKNAWDERFFDFFSIIKRIKQQMETHIQTCSGDLKSVISAQVSNNESMQQLREENFDFGITELISPCGYAVFHKIGLTNYATAFATDILAVLSSSLGVNSNPSYVPNSMQDAIQKSSFAFINSDQLLQDQHLSSPKLVYIGGIATTRPKSLNKQFQDILNKSNSVVLVSFGSLAKSSNMPQHIKNSFRETFRSFPEITFIWKYEEDDQFAHELPNVIKKQWIPQQELLEHPKLKVFISHCGQNSVEESVQGGVPLLCIPLFGDQMRNTGKVLRRKIGIFVDKHHITPEVMKNALLEILYDKRYLETSLNLREMIKNKPITPQESLLRHINFASKFGPIDNFDIALNKLSFFQYYLLDILIPLLAVFVFLLYFIFRMFRNILYKLLIIWKAKTD